MNRLKPSSKDSGYYFPATNNGTVIVGSKRILGYEARRVTYYGPFSSLEMCKYFSGFVGRRAYQPACNAPAEHFDDSCITAVIEDPGDIYYSWLDPSEAPYEIPYDQLTSEWKQKVNMA